MYSEKLNSLNTTYKYSLNDFLINNKIEKLTNLGKESCEKPITENEILNSLKQLHNGKNRGPIGLSTSFYKFVWIDILERTLDYYRMLPFILNKDILTQYY